MKHLRKCKFLALFLAFCMCFTAVAPLSAEAAKGKAATQSVEKAGKKNNKKTNNDNSSSSESSSETAGAVELILEEDETTVVNGDMLRASTYGIATAAETGTAVAAAETSSIKYFPVTMFNYDAGSGDESEKEAGFNLAMHQYEVDHTSSLTKWNGMYFSAGNPKNASYTYTVDKDEKETGTLPYANHNKWTGNFEIPGVSKHGNNVYSGLVKSTLDANKNIQFTVPDVGLFTNTPVDGKHIYTNVGLPFVYNTAEKKYTFDANTMGAYFVGGAASNKNLTYFDAPQRNTNVSVQDGRKNGWYPFNGTDTVTVGTADYYFGMAATIPFTMTADGKLSSAADAQDIVFNFSGDDDVWVFIDGQLVLDLGGIHNGVNGSLNFAENKFDITRMVTTVGGETADASGNNAPMSGRIFNDANGTGMINQTRESFAAKDSHELTVYYLERGAGSSNCKIEFNLPMKDSVSVTKRVSEVDSSNVALADDVLAQINNRDFGFTLYKDGTKVANYTYSVLNENGQYVQSASTNGSGHFTLKNNQTAKFIGEIAAGGNGYYVVEDNLGTGWENPAFTYTASAANGATKTESTTAGQSMTVTARGSEEAEDSVSFVCTNTMTHVDGTSLEVNDDTIVIDYGLPVEIDVLVNDVVVAGTKSITEVTGAQFGTAEIKGDKIKYTLTKQLTDVEVLTYTAKATASNGAVGDNKTATANVYIIPATQMYYEENFNGLVSKAVASGGDPIESVGTPFNECQEPGVVGTVDDSPYGSDVLYLNNTGDSNGTSTHFNLTKAANQFKYTFTGTGTTFFARTNKSSAYMRVVITDSDGKTVHNRYRDNKYLSERTIDKEATLYNIPVFTWMADNYGTYTVTVTLAKTSTTYGNEFYLDGIRVFSPLDPISEKVTIAEDAYATDNEANCVVETLREKLIAGNMDYDEMADQYVWAGINQEENNFVLLTDNNDKIIYAQDYVSDGPKEEVYLYDGQKVSFKVENWNPNTDRVYLGIKAPMGTGTVILNGQSRAINNTVDCYYTITDANVVTEEDGTKTAYIEVKAGTGCLISVTNVKVTGGAVLEATGPGESIDVQY